MNTKHFHKNIQLSEYVVLCLFFFAHTRGVQKVCVPPPDHDGEEKQGSFNVWSIFEGQ